MKRLIAFAIALCLSGCTTAEGEEITAAPGTGELAVGTSMVIIPFLTTDQIEGGSTSSPVDDIRSDDPSIARLAFTTRVYRVGQGQTTHGVIVYGVSPGTTRLRLFNGDSDEGTLPVTVVPAAH